MGFDVCGGGVGVCWAGLNGRERRGGKGVLGGGEEVFGPTAGGGGVYGVEGTSGTGFGVGGGTMTGEDDEELSQLSLKGNMISALTENGVGSFASEPQ